MADPSLIGDHDRARRLGTRRCALPARRERDGPGRVFVTVHGGSADAVDALTGRRSPTGSATAVDAVRRQVEVRVPYDVFDPRGETAVRVAAASGLWDPAANAYQPQPNGAAFFNVAFRGDEPPSAWRTNAQAAALAAGRPLAALRHGRLHQARGGDRRRARRARQRLHGPHPGQRERGPPGPRRRGQPQARLRGAVRAAVLRAPAALRALRPAGPGAGRRLRPDASTCTAAARPTTSASAPSASASSASAAGSCSRRRRGATATGTSASAAVDVFETWADVARRYALDPAVTGDHRRVDGRLRRAEARRLLSRPVLARRRSPCPAPAPASPGPASAASPAATRARCCPSLPSLRNVPVMSWQTIDDQTCVYADQMALRRPPRRARLPLRRAGRSPASTTTRWPRRSLSESGPQAEFLGDAPDRAQPRARELRGQPGDARRRRAASAPTTPTGSPTSTPLSATEPGTVHVRSDGLGRVDPGPSAAAETERRAAERACPTSPRPASTASPAASPAQRRLTHRRRRRQLDHHRRAAREDGLRADDGCRRRAPAARAPRRLQHDLRHQAGLPLDPVFDVVVRAPSSERPRSAKVVFGGRSLPLRRHKARIDVKGRTHAMARVRVASVDGHGRTIVRATSHRFCPVR